MFAWLPRLMAKLSQSLEKAGGIRYAAQTHGLHDRVVTAFWPMEFASDAPWTSGVPFVPPRYARIYFPRDQR